VDEDAHALGLEAGLVDDVADDARLAGLVDRLGRDREEPLPADDERCEPAALGMTHGGDEAGEKGNDEQPASGIRHDHCAYITRSGREWIRSPGTAAERASSAAVTGL